MKICIVGGTGNISTSIVKLLLRQGHEVTVYNRGETRAAPEGARLLRGDRGDRAAFEAAIQAERFDAGIDMICFNREDAESSIRAFRGVGHFVQCSTVCTYGIQYDWFPSGEDHPLRPISDYGRNKVAADAAFLAAHYSESFPVTIIKPSTTYGPAMGLIRQVAWDFSWIDRVRKGKPILVCGDGNALHQFMHVDDAALAFAGVLGKAHCIGNTYNMVNDGYRTWVDFHRTAMNVLGRQVELVGVPLQTLEKLDIPACGICKDIFAHHLYYSNARLRRDVPEFQPCVTLETGMRNVIEAMDRDGRVPNSDEVEWEDRIIAGQLAVGKK